MMRALKVKMLRISLMSASVAAIAVAAATPAVAQAQVRSFDIPAQPLSSALLEFSRQSDVLIVVAPELTEGRRAPALRASLPANEAIARLLRGSGLRAVPNPRGGYRIERQATSSNSRPTQTASSSGDTPSSRDGAGSDSEAERTEIVVTGSRLRGATATGTITSFDRTQIERTGVVNTGDLLEYAPQQNVGFSEERTSSGQQYAQLRGLPAGNTLVLINGRRPGFSAADGNVNAFNLNLIPLAAIERVDILSDSASAIYGADAIGGVVNIVTKRRVERPTLEARYGSVDGDAPEWRVSGTAGLERGGFRAVAIVDYLRRQPLLGRSRDRFSNADYRRFGGLDLRITQTVPGSVVSTGIGNLPGLTSRFAIVREGANSSALTLADFIAVPAEAGLQSESARRFESIIVDREQYSTAAFAEYEVSPTITLFGDFLYSNSTTIADRAPPTSNLTLPAANPFNPFGANVTVRYLFAENFGPLSVTNESEQLFGTLGARGALGTWDWEVWAQHSVSDSSSTQNALDTAQVNCLLTNPSARAPGACKGINEAFNPFENGPGGSPALVASLARAPSVTEISVRGWQAQGFLRGRVLELPAGSVEAVFGAAWSQDDYEASGLFGGHRTATAFFGEVNIPIASGGRVVPIGDLTLRLAARYDSYSDFGDTFNPQATLTWQPLRSLVFDGSYSTNFSPPSLFQLFRPRSESTFTAADPLRNNLATAFLQITGGNPDLEPERGETWNVGVRWYPDEARRIELSARYWWLDLTDRVSGLALTDIIRNADLLPGRVVRSAPTASDIAAGIPGQLVSVDNSAVNFARLKTDGLDLSAQSSVDAFGGELTTRLSATWINSFQTDDVPGAPVVERVGIFPNPNVSVPRWRGAASLSWTGDPISISGIARYYGSIRDGVVTNGQFVPNGYEADDFLIFDVQASFRLSSVVGLVGERSRLTIGARNLFDKMPPFGSISTNSPYAQGDLIGRSLYAALSLSF